MSGNRAVGGNASVGGFQGGSVGAGALALTGFLGEEGAATITGATLANNVAQGGAGALSDGGSAEGGAASVRFTTLNITDSVVVENKSIGGDGSDEGGFGGAGSRGGAAFTGGMHLSENTTGTVRETTFARNLSQGGAGGAGSAGTNGGAGGASFGAGASNVLAHMTFDDCTFVQNVAKGGAGGAGGAGAVGGAGGRGQGGALWNVLAFGFDPPYATHLTVQDSHIFMNEVLGGDGGAAGAGGLAGVGGNADGGAIFSSRIGVAGQVTLNVHRTNIHHNSATAGAGAVGGNARGGAVMVDTTTVATVSGSTLHHNLVRGGDGTDGGDGLGGGIYVASGATATVATSKVRHNQASGGRGAEGGSDGEGIGGGVYILGDFFLDALSRIDHNDASDSDDDVFGLIIPF